MTPPVVCCCLPDKLGGVYTIVQNIVSHVDAKRFRYRVVLTGNRVDEDSRGVGEFAGAEVRRVEHEMPRENLYAALRRVRRAIGDDPGVLLANDWIELAAITDHALNKAVVSVVHGDHAYYYDLALRHERVIDAFISYSRRVDARLRELFPHRAAQIFYVAPGVPLPANVWQPRVGPLRIMFVGRMHRDKGIFLFPEIDRLLCEQGHEVRWTLVGDGPERAALGERWSPSRVQWITSRPAAQVVEMYGDHDVFLLPSAFEGLPVTLLEAGAAGVVPVTSDLPSGIPEVVEHAETGFRVPIGDVDGFVASIAALDDDRSRLAAMSQSVRARVRERFDVRDTAASYEEVFARWESLRRPRETRLPVPYGSRLDQPWMPNTAVRLIRRLARASHGR